MGTPAPRVWSWAATEDDVRARRRHAEQLIGERISLVTYVMIDYEREERHPELVGKGPRLVDGDAEWARPTWAHSGFDAVDFGIELTTAAGATFSLTWDPPGHQEGIGLQAVGLSDSALASGSDVAVWQVGDRARYWHALVGKPITDIRLRYERWWDGPGFWCPHITIGVAGPRLDIVLGDAHDGELVYSADNIAVLHPTTALPAWGVR